MLPVTGPGSGSRARARPRQESEVMRHAVEKYFRRERERRRESFKPLTSVFIEQDIGKAAHISARCRSSSPCAMRTARRRSRPCCRPGGGGIGRGCIIVGPANTDPYKQHADAIEALAEHFDMPLDRAHCYPYRREYKKEEPHGLHARTIRRQVSRRAEEPAGHRGRKAVCGLVRTC